MLALSLWEVCFLVDSSTSVWRFSLLELIAAEVTEGRETTDEDTDSEEIKTELEAVVIWWALEKKELVDLIWFSEDLEELGLAKEELTDSCFLELTTEDLLTVFWLDNSGFPDAEWTLDKETLDVKPVDIVDKPVAAPVKDVGALVIKFVDAVEVLVILAFIADDLDKGEAVVIGIVWDSEDSNGPEVTDVETVELTITVWLLGYMGVILCIVGVK